MSCFIKHKWYYADSIPRGQKTFHVNRYCVKCNKRQIIAIQYKFCENHYITQNRRKLILEERWYWRKSILRDKERAEMDKFCFLIDYYNRLDQEKAKIERELEKELT